MRSRSTVDAFAVAALGLLALASMAGGTNASFTATTVNPNNLFATATLSLSNDKAADGSLVSLSNMVPGDTASRTVIITNTGNVGFTYSGSAAPLSSTLLWTDLTNGLQVTVKRGVNVLYTGALKNLAIPASPTIAPAATDTLTFVFSLPATADNSFQGLTQTFTITYTATQLAGTAR
ncbi:MAG: hypothetical protein HYU87_08195 [Chloroflexi bacterium]|nr:hypothetical protein [Chloroflexota bacterium]